MANQKSFFVAYGGGGDTCAIVSLQNSDLLCFTPTRTTYQSGWHSRFLEEWSLMEDGFILEFYSKDNIAFI